MEDLARLVPRLLGGGGGGGGGGSAVAYIASKRHYFGVGGGTTEFRQVLLPSAAASAAAGDVAGDEPHAAAAPTLEITSEAEMEDGCSNVREILSVRAEVGATGAPRPPFPPDLTEIYLRFATPRSVHVLCPRRVNRTHFCLQVVARRPALQRQEAS